MLGEVEGPAGNGGLILLLFDDVEVLVGVLGLVSEGSRS